MERVLDNINQAIYIDRKIDHYIKEFEIENLNTYIIDYNKLYNNIKISSISIFFALFHREFNVLFKYTNTRIRNGRITADESRLLLYLIDELKTVQANVRNTPYEFEVNQDYARIIEEMDKFLEESYGSPIPNGFERIIILENIPMFYLKSSVETTTAKVKGLFSTKLIGEGSYATVYKYKDEYYNRFFVIKKAHKSLTEKELERFRIEFEEMQKLKSPYVIEVYTFDEMNFQYIMEYADVTLDKYISINNSIIKMNERIGLVRQILQAFIYISSKGVFHRDISTRNILIKKYDGLNVIKVSDFGLVKRENSCLTSKNTQFKGSLNDPKLEVYGFDTYEIRHETYALTRLVYFVMTGRINIRKMDNNDFEAFINKGISDNMEERYSSVEELKSEFSKVTNNYFV
ncbi:protein kinase domain-containing protein [Marininema halotolerans]|uniref:Protein kinase domain-containing protein n=1 Tax=Marininema halotolerans TaxID=1155944 RepID=A0A1I6P7A6_9BACL|nr:protein kinase [Marininema halotolerans]SFS36073.1 Protein kinase domain-containing protein [Marininema halotolerans]